MYAVHRIERTTHSDSFHGLGYLYIAPEKFVDHG
jgi:hypothetical protein